MFTPTCKSFLCRRKRHLGTLPEPNQKEGEQRVYVDSFCCIIRKAGASLWSAAASDSVFSPLRGNWYQGGEEKYDKCWLDSVCVRVAGQSNGHRLLTVHMHITDWTITAALTATKKVCQSCFAHIKYPGNRGSFHLHFNTFEDEVCCMNKWKSCRAMGGAERGAGKHKHANLFGWENTYDWFKDLTVINYDGQFLRAKKNKNKDVCASKDEAPAFPMLLGLMFMPQMLQQQIVG